MSTKHPAAILEEESPSSKMVLLSSAVSARRRFRRHRGEAKTASVMVTTVALLLLLTVDHRQRHVSCLQPSRLRMVASPQSNNPNLNPSSLSPPRASSFITSTSATTTTATSTTATSPSPPTAITTTVPSTTTSTSLGSSVVAPSSSSRRGSAVISRVRQLATVGLPSLVDRVSGSRRRQEKVATVGDPPSALKTEEELKAKDSVVPTDRQWTKRNLAIALPALMGLLADPVLSMVDTAFVGRMSSIDLAALGVCTSLFHMSFTIFRASTVATTSLVSSAESVEEKRQITKISLAFAGVMGTLVMLALRFGGPSMLGSMGISKEASPAMYKSACDYLFSRCWAAPAVVGLVVSEGAFRGNHDNSTPLIVASIAALINLVLDPLLMFPLGMGMAGAALATAFSQVGGASLYAWRLWKRQLLPQAHDKVKVSVSNVLKKILGANAACLAKNGSMLVFYTLATAFATRMGAAHVATHQVCLSVFWLVTMWLDSGSVSAQLLMAESTESPAKARSLTRYMMKFALTQGLAFSALVAGIGKFVPGGFTSDPTVMAYIAKCLPYLAFQQTLVSLCLVLEGLAAGGNQFKFLASGTAAATVAGFWQMTKATSVIDIWASAVNVFFGLRTINALIGVIRVHMDIGRRHAQKVNERQPTGLATIQSPLTPSGTS